MENSNKNPKTAGKTKRKKTIRLRLLKLLTTIAGHIILDKLERGEK